VTDALFCHCWDVLHGVGWRNFTWQHVISRYPQWCISDIETRFSSPYGLIIAFSESIPPQNNPCTSKSAAVFDVIMYRLDYVWPYRDIFTEAISNLPPKDLGPMVWPVFAFFYRYWQSDFENKLENKQGMGTFVGNDGESIRGNPSGRNQGALGMCMGEKNRYALFWSAVSVILYAFIFPYAMVHAYEETLARLDRGITFFLDWLKKWHPSV